MRDRKTPDKHVEVNVNGRLDRGSTPRTSTTKHACLQACFFYESGESSPWLTRFERRKRYEAAHLFVGSRRGGESPVQHTFLRTRPLFRRALSFFRALLTTPRTSTTKHACLQACFFYESGESSPWLTRFERRKRYEAAHLFVGSRRGGESPVQHTFLRTRPLFRRALSFFRALLTAPRTSTMFCG